MRFLKSLSVVLLMPVAACSGNRQPEVTPAVQYIPPAQTEQATPPAPPAPPSVSPAITEEIASLHAEVAKLAIRADMYQAEYLDQIKITRELRSQVDQLTAINETLSQRLQQNTSSQQSQSLPFTTSDDLNCEHFLNQEAAQLFYEKFPNNNQGLSRSSAKDPNNQKACEGFDYEARNQRLSQHQIPASGTNGEGLFRLIHALYYE